MIRIGIIGAGGVGGYFGGRLASLGEQVIFVARGKHLAAMRERGLFVKSIAGDFSVPAATLRAVEDPAEVGPVDVLLFCVKTWQLEAAAEQARPMVGAETLVVPLQNGVDAQARLERALGRGKVAMGTCRIGAEKTGPGHIVHAAAEPTIHFGMQGAIDPRLLALQRAFVDAGVRAEVPPDIERVLWQKLAFVAPFGALGAVTGERAGVLRSHPESRALLRDLTAEIVGLGQGRGVGLTDGDVERALGYLDALPKEATTSLQRDVANGQPSEVESWLGSPVRMGLERGVRVRGLEALYTVLLLRQREPRR